MPTIAESLLPEIRNWRMAHWCAVWCAVTIATCACWRVQCFLLSGANRELAELQQVCQPLIEAEAQLAEMGARSAAISRREVAVEQLQPDQRATTLLGVIGRAAANRIAVEELQFTLEEDGRIQLQGLGGDVESVNRFVNGLHSAGEFSAMELKSVAPRVATEAREFQVEGRLN